MKKLRFVLLMMVFGVAFGSAVLTSAKPEEIVYYRWDPMDGSECIEEDECGAGTVPCGHAVFTPGLASNCQVPQTLQKI